jgi:hypothetical protein
VHGGQELLVNSLHVPYYKAGQFTGAAIGARHNLEVGSYLAWLGFGLGLRPKRFAVLRFCHANLLVGRIHTTRFGFEV